MFITLYYSIAVADNNCSADCHV